MILKVVFLITLVYIGSMAYYYSQNFKLEKTLTIPDKQIEATKLNLYQIKNVNSQLFPAIDELAVLKISIKNIYMRTEGSKIFLNLQSDFG